MEDGHIPVLVVDPDPPSRQGLLGFLLREADLAPMGEAADGREALRLSQELRPRVVLLDLGLLDPPAAVLFQQLQRHCPEVRVLALATRGWWPGLGRLLAIGLPGLMLRAEVPESLAAAVRALAAGGSWLSPHLAPLAAHGAVPELSLEELEVLPLVGAGQTEKQAGAGLGISDRAVRYRLESLRGRLGLGSMAELLVCAGRHGLA